MNKYRRFSEKLMAALRVLATSNQSMSERLTLACHELVTLAPPDGPLPDELRAAFAKLWSRVTTVSGSQGSLKATVETLSRDDQSEAAREIFDLAVEAERLYWKSEFSDSKSSG